MGYTHYWTQRKDLSPESFAQIGADIAKIIEKSNVTIVDGFGNPGTKPQIDANVIAFNGVGDDAHETFLIRPAREEPYPGGRLGWSFCKTAYKPYDVVVTACLTYLAAKWDFEVTSDGDRDDWLAGNALAKDALGECFDNPLKR